MEFSFKVTEAEANIIVAALAKQPFEIVVGLIGKLQQQAGEQSPPSAPGIEPGIKK